MKKILLNKNIVKLIAAITFVLIAVTAVIFKANPLNVLPLFVSIIVMFLQTKVNRFAFIIGSINSLFYAAAYFYMTLYSQSLYAALVSFPIQIFTFFAWNRNTKGGVTKTKSLSNKTRVIMLLTMAVVWLMLFAVFSAFDSSYLILDNTLAVIGIAASFLCFLRYSEYSLLQTISTTVTIILYSIMITDDISKIVWLIFSIYSAICSVIAFININRLSKQGE